MGIANVGHNADIGFCDRRQFANLARVVHADFQNRSAAFIGQSQDRKWHADVVVEVANRLPDLPVDGEQVRNRILRGGLTCAAGHTDHSPAPLPTRPRRQRFYSGKRIGYINSGCPPEGRSTTAATAPCSLAARTNA